MRKLTTTEKYALFVINKHNRKVVLYRDTRFELPIYISILNELISDGYINYNKEGIVSINNNTRPSINYQGYTYRMILESNKQRSIRKWVEIFWSKGVKYKKETVNNIIDNLIIEKAIYEEDKKSFFGMKTMLYTEKDIFEPIVKSIRYELLNDKEISSDIVFLIMLLIMSNLLKDFFSKHEQKQIKDKLNKIKASELYKEMMKIINGINAIIMTMTNTSYS